MYIYICISVCIYVCIYINIWMDGWMDVYTVCMYVYMYIYIYSDLFRIGGLVADKTNTMKIYIFNTSDIDRFLGDATEGRQHPRGLNAETTYPSTWVCYGFNCTNRKSHGSNI